MSAIRIREKLDKRRFLAFILDGPPQLAHNVVIKKCYKFMNPTNIN